MIDPNLTCMDGHYLRGNESSDYFIESIVVFIDDLRDLMKSMESREQADFLSRAMKESNHTIGISVVFRCKCKGIAVGSLWIPTAPIVMSSVWSILLLLSSACQ